MKYTSRPWTALLCLALASAVPVLAGAASIQLSPLIAVDPGIDDVTFQILETAKAGDAVYLCFWEGDALPAIVTTSHDAFSGELKSFLAFNEKRMKESGSKDLK